MTELSYYEQNQKRIKTIEEFTFKGLFNRMKKHFGLPIPPVFFTGSDKMRAAKTIRDRLENKLTYPIVLVKPQNYEIRADSYAPKSLHRHGSYSGKPVDDSNTELRKTQPLPVTFSMEVTCLTDSWDFAQHYINRWLYLAVGKNLNMEVIYDDVSYSVQVEPDSNVAVPEADRSAETADHYELIGTIMVKGYISPSIALDEYPRVPIVRQINGNLHMVTDVDEETGEEIPDFVISVDELTQEENNNG